jgi:4-alpha-glucanotransferase
MLPVGPIGYGNSPYSAESAFAGSPLLVTFNTTGQRWGNPLYRWKRMKRQKYRWWIDRLKITLSRFDLVRLDHFIGFQRYWATRTYDRAPETLP